MENVQRTLNEKLNYLKLEKEKLIASLDTPEKKISLIKGLNAALSLLVYFSFIVFLFNIVEEKYIFLIVILGIYPFPIIPFLYLAYIYDYVNKIVFKWLTNSSELILSIKSQIKEIDIRIKEIETNLLSTIGQESNQTFSSINKTTNDSETTNKAQSKSNSKEFKKLLEEEPLLIENKKNSVDLEEARLDLVFSKKAEESERKAKLIKEENLIKEFKKDYIGDAEQKQEIGLEGELFIIRYEEKQLIKKGREDLAKKIEHISLKYGDSYGYDILSFDEKGNEKYIEVKTTIKGIKTDFYMSDNEYQKAINTNNYFIYRIYDFDVIEKKGKFYPINTLKDLDKHFKSKPITYQFTPPKF